MNNPMCEKCILYLEHKIINEAMCEWIGMDREHAIEDINYLQGVHDFAHRAVEALESDETDE